MQIFNILRRGIIAKIFLAVALIFTHKATAFPQLNDYKTIFGNNWDKAELFVTENEKWMKPVCEKNNIPYTFAVAIVFPELVRYSALRDRIEISLLKTLYVNLGEEYADFSIGPFQMKPSFAELVHQKADSINDRKLRSQFKTKQPAKDARLFRSFIVTELEDLKREFGYLMAFIKICESSYPPIWKEESEKLRFFATVYNCGLDKSLDYMRSMLDKKFFSTKLIKSETYSYSDISICWYENHITTLRVR